MENLSQGYQLLMDNPQSRVEVANKMLLLGVEQEKRLQQQLNQALERTSELEGIVKQEAEARRQLEQQLQACAVMITRVKGITQKLARSASAMGAEPALLESANEGTPAEVLEKHLNVFCQQFNIQGSGTVDTMTRMLTLLRVVADLEVGTRALVPAPPSLPALPPPPPEEPALPPPSQVIALLSPPPVPLELEPFRNQFGPDSPEGYVEPPGVFIPDSESSEEEIAPFSLEACASTSQPPPSPAESVKRECTSDSEEHFTSENVARDDSFEHLPRKRPRKQSFPSTSAASLEQPPLPQPGQSVKREPCEHRRQTSLEYRGKNACVCGRVFLEDYRLYRHIRYYEGLVPIKCPFTSPTVEGMPCLESFQSTTKLNKHVRLFHGLERSSFKQCNLCRELIPTRNAGMRKHYQEIHNPNLTESEDEGVGNDETESTGIPSEEFAVGWLVNDDNDSH